MTRFKTPTHELDQTVTELAFNEVQRVTLAGLGGSDTWTLTFDGEKTANIDDVATPAAVQAALEGLSNVQPGDVSVADAPGTAYDVTFQGQYAGQSVPTLTGAATTGSVAVTVTQEGGDNPLAVQRGTGNADATQRTDPLDGLSPAEQRAADPSAYGDTP